MNVALILVYSESLWRDVWLLIISFLLFTGTLYVYFRLRAGAYSRFAGLLEERVQVKTRQLVEKTIELEKLSLVASRTDNAVLLAGPTGIVEWVNEGFLYRYHRRSEDVIGHKLGYLGLHHQVEEELRKAIESRKAQSFESYLPASSGREQWISTTLTPIYDDQTGAMKKLVLVDTDITYTKRMQEQIQHSLKEKDVLLKEIHHRVKNNLQIIISLLNLQSGYIRDEATLKVVKDGQLRVRSMALVHEKFYQAEELLEINFSEYIEKLCHYLYQAYGDKSDRIKVELHTDPVGLDMDTAMPCGLLVNELVSNAYKYAFPVPRTGAIRIYLKRNDGTVSLRIQDDGVGLGAEFNLAATETLGMQLIQALTNQLDGNLLLEEGPGTTFSVTFPYPKHQNRNPDTGFSV